MGKIISIDLGTTNSCVAIMDGGRPTVIANAEGSRTTPSVVAFTDNGQLVGTPAKRQAITNPQNTVYSIKRFMGRCLGEVTNEEKQVSYNIKGKGNQVYVSIGDKQYSPPEISAMILRNLKKTAEEYLGEVVTEAVITVPAYFNDSQRQATKDAGKIAGLDVKRIINEPTAASLAYGMDKKQSKNIAVFDIGGGTADFSILEAGDGVFEVLSTNGDSTLGGDDFDNAIVEWIIGEFKKSNGIDLSSDPMAYQRLREAGEKAKCELSGKESTDINLPFITADQTGPKHLQMELTRSKFNQLSEHLVDRARKACKLALTESGLDKDKIDEVLLVGGSTRIPAVRDVCTELFGKEPDCSVNPDEAVAMGAAIQGGVLSGDIHDLVLLDVTPLTLGIETIGGVSTPLIEKNTTIPVKKSETFSTAIDNQPNVEINVLQGERSMAADNRSLGKFMLTGIPPAQRGVPQIVVEFDISVDGIVNVSAHDKGTNRKQNIVIQNSSGLSKDEIERMVHDAEENAEADEKKSEMVSAKNQAETLIYNTERNLNEYGNKLDDSDREEIEKSVAELKQVCDGDDIEAIKKANETLATASQKLGEAMYQKQQESQETPGTSGDNVADAEVVSEDDTAEEPEAEMSADDPE